MGVGPVLVGGGLALLSRAPDGHTYVAAVLPGVLVLAAGLAVTVAPLTSTALNSVSESHAGLASAVNNDVARLGGLIAVAVLPALGGIAGLGYLHPVTLAHGFQRAVVIAGMLCVIGGILAAIGIRNPARSPELTSPVAADQLTYCALDATPLR